MKAIGRFEARAEKQQLFYRHEIIFRDDIEMVKARREKELERQRRIAAGEELSDTSSVKEQKRKQKAK